MQKEDKKSYIRLIYKTAFSYLGVALVLSLLLGSLLGGNYYIVSAVCACGFVLICWGWFGYLKMTGMRLLPKGDGKKKPKVPYIHKKDKDKKMHRPSFRMDSDDFDDDLTSKTAVKAENFTEKQADTARIIARIACGIIMVIISFLIPIN